MTWPMTLAELSCAGAVSKPHHYKQNVQKMKGLLRKRALTENSLKFSNQKAKNSSHRISYGEQNKKTTRSWRQKLNMNHVARKKLTEAKLKKAFRIKLFELFKTRTNKSFSDQFIFHVVLTGHDMVKDTAGLPRAGAISEPHDYKQNVQKMKGLLKKWALTRNSLKISDKKFQKFHSSHGEQIKRTTSPQGQKLNMNHITRQKLTESKLKKAFRRKLFELCKTRTKKSSPHLFNFYVISAGHDMAIDTGRAITCRRSFKAPWLQTERTKNEGPSEKMSFNGEQFENFKPRKPRNPIILWRTKQKNHKNLKAKTEHEPCSQEEIKWSKIEKSIQNKTVRTLQD